MGIPILAIYDFMNNKTRLLLIQDIGPVLNSLRYEIPELYKTYNINYDSIDCFFEWAINNSLEKDYGMHVMGHRKIDEYAVAYSHIAHSITYAMAKSVNRYDLQLLFNNEVRTLVNGHDLFITRRNLYRYHDTF